MRNSHWIGGVPVNVRESVAVWGLTAAVWVLEGVQDEEEEAHEPQPKRQNPHHFTHSTGHMFQRGKPLKKNKWLR